jgi:hypothetical protein
MKVGDLIYDSHFKERGLVVAVLSTTGNDGWCKILYEDGQIVGNIRSWEETIEVISESR